MKRFGFDIYKGKYNGFKEENILEKKIVFVCFVDNFFVYGIYLMLSYNIMNNW